MRAVKDFIMREIAGETILIPSGSAAKKFNGLITVNEIGAFIWNALSEDLTLDALTERITEAYEVDAATAKNAGMDAAIVGWGYRDRDFLLTHGAEEVVGTVAELLEKII